MPEVQSAGMTTQLSSADLLAVLADRQTVADLTTYFGLKGSTPYTGSRFESLSGGGDRDAVVNQVVADDLIAVQMLSITVPASAALKLLEGAVGQALAEQLANIPTSLDLGSPGAGPSLAKGTATWNAYDLLNGVPGVGWVTASKILARKRPRLIPVYDQVVRCALGSPLGHWAYFNERFDDGELVKTLDELRAATGVPEQVSLPRVLDVVLWMRHHGSHTRARCERKEFPVS